MCRALIKAVLLPILLVLGTQGCSRDSALQPWHTEKLSGEFTAEMAEKQVRNFAEYQALEQRLFQQLNDKIYARPASQTVSVLSRYRPGSNADPRRRQPNWNRSFEFTSEQPVGGVLLLHGMSDSPYSLRAAGLALNRHGYHVIGLRLPGHGTVPSGLRHVHWRDMSAAVNLAVTHLSAVLGDKPLHFVGYSTGASLALEYAIRGINDSSLTTPASLVLLSPAIRIHPVSALASLKDGLSVLPGLDGLAYLSIMEEFDPYKYNSFATNAAAQVHQVTRHVDQRLSELDMEAKKHLPPILVFKSAVDSTVSTEAVVDNLLKRLPAGRNELVLFDINRHAKIKSTLLVEDPGPITTRLVADANLPFAVTIVGNQNAGTNRIAVRHKMENTARTSDSSDLSLSWPGNVVSLSHIALPFPPDDPLYGRQPPTTDEFIYLGNLAFHGERGLLRIPADWLLRMRYNPFYAYLEQRMLQWLASNG
jgi:alpha-beta hydrolase superfamily lysophospholipase